MENTGTMEIKADGHGYIDNKKVYIENMNTFYVDPKSEFYSEYYNNLHSVKVFDKRVYAIDDKWSCGGMKYIGYII